MRFLFWTSTFFIIYPYFIYPIILWLYGFALLKKTKISAIDETNEEPVSVIVAVKDEEKNIRNKIMNLMSQDYDSRRFEIIIVSDGSKDQTNDVISEVCHQAIAIPDNPIIKFIAYSPSQGKAFAINTAVASASGNILVFTDARQRLDNQAIRTLCGILKNPKIGCVSGELVFEGSAVDKEKPEMGLYWRYEKWIRKQEALSGSTVGATGAIYAVKKTLFEPIPRNTILDDVLVPMNVVNKGYLSVFSDEAKAYDKPSSKMIEEWYRKVRTLAGNWQLIFFNKKLMLPWSNRIWFRFFSHKFLRLLVPFFLILVFFTNLSLINHDFYRGLIFIQVFVYLLLGLSHIYPSIRHIRFINICYFFMIVNIAAIMGFYYALTGNTRKLWRKD